jgi:ribonucleoside-diphosphate reductase alpha chain
MDPIYGYSKDSAPTWVIHFPVKSPENSITRSDQSLTDQLERWKSVKLNYTDHNPSVTIYFEEDEIFELAQWIFQNQEIIGGMSFLPEDDTHYPQMPYEEISKEEYEKLVSEFPDIDFALLYFEKSDYTTSSQEVACVANSCEI